MKKKTLIIIIAACVVVALAAAAIICIVCNKKEDKPVLTMGTNAAFPPYEYYENDKIVGIDAEIAAAIAEKMGYALEIKDMDFDTLVPSVAAGKIDFSMAGMTVTEARLQSVFFSTSYAKGVQAIIVPEGSPITTVDDLYAEGAAYKVGVQEGTTGDIYCSDDFGEELVFKYKNGAEAVASMVAGKLDCVIIDNNPAKAFVEANEGLKILESSYADEDYAAALSYDNPELCEKFNAAINDLISDGTIAAILNKYIPAE